MSLDMNNLLFGISLDIGICGWAVTRQGPTPVDPVELIDLGTWKFDVPETPRDLIPLARQRRAFRQGRRLRRRKAQRMAEIRRLFASHGLIPHARRDALAGRAIDPAVLRMRGLDEPLDRASLARALIHIAKNRGFQPRAKVTEGLSANDEQTMLRAIGANRLKLQNYRSVGEMLVRDAAYQSRRRNKANDHGRMQSREDLVSEAIALFEAQRRLGNRQASLKLQQDFLAAAFSQRPLQDPSDLVGPCPLEPSEKRAALRAPSFEKFRLLSRLGRLRIDTGTMRRALTPAELEAACSQLGQSTHYSVKDLRDRITLRVHEKIILAVPRAEHGDLVTPQGGSFIGTYQLRKALGEHHWEQLVRTPEALDHIADTLTFARSRQSAFAKFADLGLAPDIIDALCAAWDEGAFSNFRGVSRLSAKAIRNLISPMTRALRFDAACANVGYETQATWPATHDRQGFQALLRQLEQRVTAGVAHKVVGEGLRQLWAMRNRWGSPASIHIEIGQDVTRSPEDRFRIRRILEAEAASARRDKARVAAFLAIEEPDADTIMRFRLAEEQGWICPFTGEAIGAEGVLGSNSNFCIDLILPWDRFGDARFSNKVLCKQHVVEERRGLTPQEWIRKVGGDGCWETFVERIQTCVAMRRSRKRNYLLADRDNLEDRIFDRNTHDRRPMANLLKAASLTLLAREKQGPGHDESVRMRPSPLVRAVQRELGLSAPASPSTEIGNDARRAALDALAVVASSDPRIGSLTPGCSSSNDDLPAVAMALSWSAAVTAAQASWPELFVARPERRRARGAGHEATVRQIRQCGATTAIYERRPIADIPSARIGELKDPQRNAAIAAALADWVARGRPVDDLPRSPAGDVIQSVRVRRQAKPGVAVRGGTAERGRMVRADIFSKPSKKGIDQFFLIPVYAHQVADERRWPHPPGHIARAHKDEADWEKVDERFMFLFSIYSGSYLEIEKADGTTLSGYVAEVMRGSATICLCAPENHRLRRNRAGASLDGIGIMTARSITKLAVGRLGERAPVLREPRLWHGKICPHVSTAD